MVLADSPSRWSSHRNKVRSLLHDLPLPNLKVREITQQLFVEPEKFQEASKKQNVELTRLTGSNVQGNLMSYNVDPKMENNVKRISNPPPVCKQMV